MTRTRTATVAAAVLVLTGGMAAAYAVGEQRAKATSISACVSVKTGAMRLETAKMPCVTSGPRAAKERRLTWNEEGLPGVDGAPGTDGADGVAGADGVDGTDGSSFLSGRGTPAAGLGADGDTYLDLTSGAVHVRADDRWEFAGSLRGNDGRDGSSGRDGTDGTDGTSFRIGTTDPVSSLGADGDTYLDATTGDVWTKADGAWSAAGNLTGPAGLDGQDGKDGSSFHSGTGVPNVGYGADGDTYLDRDTGDLFVKADGAWIQDGNLSGPVGDSSGTTFLASTPASLPMTPFTPVVLPLSGVAAASASGSGPLVELFHSSDAGTVIQAMPRDTTVTEMSATVDLTVPVQVPVGLTAQIYRVDASNPSSVRLAQVPGAACSLTLPTGGIAVGQPQTCRTSGLSITVAGGERLAMVLSSPLSFGTSFGIRASTSVTIS